MDQAMDLPDLGTALRVIFTFLSWQRANNSLDGGKWGTVFPVFR